MCYTEVDDLRAENVTSRWPEARGYTDYRKMFEKEAGNFDAVMVGVPDHSHYPATVLALQHGKHCYTQKPLTHTVWEARELGRWAKKASVATQMGNQGHANEGNRVTWEWIRAGALGDVSEVHICTNRPVWPQGLNRPEGRQPVPPTLDWESWIGPAPDRPYVGGPTPTDRGPYHPFVWRGWWDFGNGALGDMACHTADAMFWAMDPGHAKSVEVVELEGATSEQFPTASVVKFRFPKNDWRPGFDFYWYDGGKRPPRPTDLEEGRDLPATGAVFIGSKATLVVGGDYGESPRIVPDAKMKEIGKPEKKLERSPGHYEEWRLAALGEKPVDFPGSNFSYAAPMSETILLGNVALRMGPGIKLEWDGPALRFRNHPEADKFLNKPYREGWDFRLT